MERKYQLARISAGDYIFLSNDSNTLWRITRYHEDGSAEWGTGQPIIGEFWATSKFDGTVAAAEKLMHIDPDEFISWASWQSYASTLRTRREAIDEALRAEEVAAMRDS